MFLIRHQLCSVVIDHRLIYPRKIKAKLSVPSNFGTMRLEFKWEIKRIFYFKISAVNMLFSRHILVVVF
jgi:hypothetical protein